jgi:glucose-1-phosphate cytidylyltransferase
MLFALAVRRQGPGFHIFIREMELMKVVILCGGRGARLNEETEFRPKPMVEIGEKPILWHIMKIFAHHGLSEFVLCLGYRGAMIKDYFLNYQAMNNDFTVRLGSTDQITFHGRQQEQDFSVTLIDTGNETMTGGRVKRVKDFIGDDAFMVTYGDGVADIDISSLLEFHRSHGKTGTVTSVRPTSRFGIMEMDDHETVMNFAEKPQVEGWVSAGFFVFNRGFFDYIDGDETSLEREPLERLAKEGQLMAYRHHGFFYCLDTYRDYKELNEMWALGRAPWKVWE